ncbi:MAG: hypothetical protein HND55_04790 [Pseudomonadota bacterium]|nr:MAG: hypothetical protein HND55_04790 [Pseudomonadota bacterium]
MNSPGKQTRTHTATEWRSPLSVTTAGILVFLAASGLIIYFWPFGALPQTALIIHTLVGVLTLAPVLAYLWIHWRNRRGGNLSHYQLIGYAAALLTLLCLISGLAVTAQALFGDALGAFWDMTHLLAGMAVPVLFVVHLVSILLRPLGRGAARQPVVRARRVFWVGCGALSIVLLAAAAVWAARHPSAELQTAFPDDYNWRFGPDRPFAPSLARIDYGDWQDGLTARLAGLLDEPERSAYRAALENPEAESVRLQHYAGHDSGLFAHHRRALQQAGVSKTETLAASERILREAAEWIQRNGALEARAMAGSERCGSCHDQIYREWLPSAHRYAAMDDLFQVVQEVMAEETSPEHTRYCAGCHDPISLFSGAKNSGNLTLSATGFEEGISCVSCHSIVNADIQGNADFTIRLPQPYLHEGAEGTLAELTADFLIRAYPRHHIESYSRPLYKTPEFCAACHKQYMDIDLNTDIGRVQGQNQYDSWARSRWHDEADPDKTIHCRECHMPLNDSRDPAAGDGHDVYRAADDGKHRNHRFLGGNQYLPTLHDLEGAAEHVRLTEQWLRGEIEIPEIADKWTEGPVVRMTIDAPETIARGERTRFQVILTNNKTGHDFPTGPLDMIESWLEVRVTDDLGRVLYHSGHLDERGAVVDPVAWFKADAFDREGELIDRHNLWDLVGKSYSRSVYPGMTDRVELPLECPSVTLRRMAAEVRDDRGRPPEFDAEGRPRRSETIAFDMPDGEEDGASRLHIESILWYRKANPDFLDRMYGPEADMRAPITEMNRATATVMISDDA